jgi:hypothetical protein
MPLLAFDVAHAVVGIPKLRHLPTFTWEYKIQRPLLESTEEVRASSSNANATSARHLLCATLCLSQSNWQLSERSALR